MSSQPRTVGRKLLWIITTTILLLIIIAILASIVGGGAMGFSELNRSFASLQTQIDANEQNLESLQSLVNSEFDVAAPRQQQEALDVLQEDVSRLQADLAMDLDTQEQKLTILEETLTTAVSNASTTESSVSDGLLVLQDDLIETNSRVDGLGGEVDSIQSELQAVNTAVASLETAVGEKEISAEELQYTFALFHTWEMITRARLRLLETNYGLAESDIEQALRAVDYLVETREEDDSNNLRVIQTRLALALSNLPARPEEANNDLDIAWNEIDQLLLVIAFPDADTAVFSTSASEEIEVTATPESDN